MSDIPDDVLDFIVSENNNISGDEEESDDWRFDDCNHDVVELLKKKNYSVNTAKKISYVLKLWNDWVSDKSLMIW